MIISNKVSDTPENHTSIVVGNNVRYEIYMSSIEIFKFVSGPGCRTCVEPGPALVRVRA